MTKPSVLLSALWRDGYPFDCLFNHVVDVQTPADVEGIHGVTDQLALIIWGGADIHPSIYGQEPNHTVHTSMVRPERDVQEVALAKKCMEMGIPIIGICRGAQLMCALSGGTLVQDITGHAGAYHSIVTDDGRTYHCPSLHHQMMHPWPRTDKPDNSGIDFELIAWTKGRSRHYWCEPTAEQDKPVAIEVPNEVEIIYIPSTKSLCIQSHPEFIHNPNDPFVRYCLELAVKYVAPWNNLNDYLPQEQAA